MPYKNRKQQRAYQRRWMAKRREKIIALMGDRCQVCGATEDLQIHHWVAEAKVSHRFTSWSWKRIKAELAKCVLLCIKCHMQLHKSELTRAEVAEIKADDRPAAKIARERSITPGTVQKIKRGETWANVPAG